MEWNKIMYYPKFTPISEFGEPKFRLGTKSIYYFENGFLVGFCNRRFNVEKDGQHVEYGEFGEYAFSISFFMYQEDLISRYRLEKSQYYFGDNPILGKPFSISQEMSIGSTFKEISTALRKHQSSETFYKEGRNSRIIDGIFTFYNQFIYWGNYELLFFGENEDTKLTAFTYYLKPEKKL